jgi:hypothetical protein
MAKGKNKGKNKGKIKDFINKAKDKINKAEDKIKKAGGAVIGKAKYAPLIPFVPMMYIALKAKGYKIAKTDIAGLTDAFYNNIVKGANGNYEDDQRNVIPPQAIELAISTIIAFIKRIKDKKEAGKKLTEEEEQVLEKSVEVAEQIEDVTEDNVLDKKIGGISVKNIGIGVAAIILVYILYKKFGK